MKKYRNTWLIFGIAILLTTVVSAFVIMQPSARDILVETLETTKTIENGHAIVELKVDSPEEKASSTVEVWGRHGSEGSGAFRLEVLKTDKAEADGAVIVSDGETVWAYSPAQGKVYTGTVEEAKAAMAEKQPLNEKHDMEEIDHPETAEEAVDELLEYFEASRTGSEKIADANAYAIELKPIPEQMPAEYTAIGGLLKVWIDQERSVPLAATYTGGSMGGVQVTALILEINQGVDESLFTFEIPAGAEIVRFADMKPEPLSMDEAAASAEFDLLTPETLPEGATLVEILNLRGTIVQRYTLTDGGSFSITQGQDDQNPKPSAEEQSVEVRGEVGRLFVSDDGERVLLIWSEGEVSFYVAGDISADQARAIAESLK